MSSRFCIQVLAVAAQALSAAPVEDLGTNLAEFQLANGMRFAVFERRDAPLTAFHVIVKTGIADEPEGKGGVARLFPRMFAQGGETVGSRNPAAEKAALDRASQAYDRWKLLANKRPPADSVDVSQAKVAFQISGEEAAHHGHPNFFRDVFGDAAAIGLDTRVDADWSSYSVALQSHQSELWFKAFSDWLRKPSTRRFHAERDALAEEASKAAAGSLQSRMEMALTAAAFGARGYGRLAAPAAEFGELAASDFEAFARAWYTPGNTVAAIVGDISSAEAKRLAETYFGRIPAGSGSQRPAAATMPKLMSQTAEAVSPDTPLSAVAWLRPPRTDPDDPVFDVIWGLLAAGRKALLPLWLQKDKIAANTSVMPNFPGDRGWSLFTAAAVPRMAVAPETLEKSLSGALAALAAQPVTDDDLSRVKSILRARLLSEMESTPGLASLLARYLANEGSAGAAAAAIAKIEKVTAADMRRVAGRYFTAEHRVALRPRVGGL